MPMSRSCVLLLLALPSARAQMSMGPEEEEMLEAMGIKGQPMGRKNLKPQAEIFKKDLKFDRCERQRCEWVRRCCAVGVVTSFEYI